MTPNALPDEILRLPPDQRFQLAENVWDSLTVTPDEVGVPRFTTDSKRNA
jgi:hypothetical protein